MDTDVAIDILTKRQPHFASSVKLLELAAQGTVRLSLSESSISNLFYFCFNFYKLVDAKERLEEFLNLCLIVSGGQLAALKALRSNFKDKEDALQFFTAELAGIPFLVTRNKRDYRMTSAILQVYTPVEFYDALAS